MGDYRVLHVVDRLSPSSGVASVVMQLIQNNNLQQDIVVYGDCDVGMEREINNRGCKIYRLPDVRILLGKKYGDEFKKLIHNQKYDIVHGHLLNSAFIYLREAKRAKIPCRIIHAHSAQLADTLIKRNRNKLLSLGLSLWANNYIATSSEASQSIFGKRKKSLTIVPCGIDVNQFKYNHEERIAARHELGIDDDVLCVGNVARFNRLKNHDFLLRVFKEILKKVNARLLLIGDGELEKTIRDKVCSEGLSNYINFLGAQKNIGKFYHAFDVFIMPSLSEGFGLAAVEAQCSGLSCILSEHIPQTVACTTQATFLPIGDANLWANTALSIQVVNRQKSYLNIENAKLDAQTMRDKIVHVYKSALSTQKNGGV